jgi:hypothetical protein
MQRLRTSESASESDWETALEREAVIRPLVEPRRLAQGIRRRGDQSPQCELYPYLQAGGPLPETTADFVAAPRKRRPYTPYRTAVDFGKRFKGSGALSVQP